MNAFNTRRRLLIVAASLPAIVTTTGCVSLADINDSLYRLDREWQLEGQKLEDEFLVRVVEVSALECMSAARSTFIALGMPVQEVRPGQISAENIAPAPLSLPEWEEIKRIETPRMKEVGGPLVGFNDKPSDYRIVVDMTLRQTATSKTIARVSYQILSPRLVAMGLRPVRHAPPTAIKLASLKIWSTMERELSSKRLPPLRKRAWNEEA